MALALLEIASEARWATEDDWFRVASLSVVLSHPTRGTAPGHEAPDENSRTEAGTRGGPQRS